MPGGVRKLLFDRHQGVGGVRAVNDGAGTPVHGDDGLAAAAQLHCIDLEQILLGKSNIRLRQIGPTTTVTCFNNGNYATLSFYHASQGSIGV